jgi:hypothetical protein
MLREMEPAVADEFDKLRKCGDDYLVAFVFRVNAGGE